MVKRPKTYFTISRAALRVGTFSLETKLKDVTLKNLLKLLLGFHRHRRKNMMLRDCLIQFKKDVATIVLSAFHTKNIEVLSWVVPNFLVKDPIRDKPKSVP